MTERIVTSVTLLREVKNYGPQMPYDVLSYQLLKNTNLKQSKEQLIKTAITKIRYGLIKEQLKNIFSYLLSPSCNIIL